MTKKTFGNTDASGAKKNVKDLVVWGDGDTFKLICKASSQEEGWMKSTKAMQVGKNCLVQVTTQQGDNVAEAVTFVPGAMIDEIKTKKGEVISRRIIEFPNTALLERKKRLTEDENRIYNQAIKLV
jgi:hypothetical protein